MKEATQILYVSALCSKKVFDYVFSTSDRKPSIAVQKFHYLLAGGLAMHPELCNVKTLTAIPVSQAEQKKKFWNVKREFHNNIEFRYVPMVNFKFLKNLSVFLLSFYEILYFNLIKNEKTRIIFCDILNLSQCASVILAAKLLRTKTIAIVTDLPGLLEAHSDDRQNIKQLIYNKSVFFLLTKFDKYIFLTEQMNTVINTANKPFAIMEGLVDVNIKYPNNKKSEELSERILIYAGGIYEVFGIKKLIQAFIKLEDRNLRLHIYGHGDMEKEMPYYMGLDSRIVYKGIVPNEVVVEELGKACLLLNPRPSDEDFTKFSFPSKNMEYMVSGTPLVSTPLPGMPVEYHEHLFLFHDETVDGIKKTLADILALQNEELIAKGMRARQFVLENKNNFIQGKKILEFSLNKV